MKQAQHSTTGNSSPTPMAQSDDDWNMVDALPSGAAALTVQPAPLALSLDLSTQAELSQYAAGSEARVAALVSLASGAGSTDGSRRAPTSLSSVIDRSGSMEGHKLDLVTSTAKFIATQMSKNDRLGVIVYDDEVDEVLPLSRMTAKNKSAVATVLDRVYAGGTTNLSGGLFQGISQQVLAAANNESGRGQSCGEDASSCFAAASSTRAVFLLTDGLPNCGICKHDKLTSMLSSALEDAREKHGVQLRVNTFGFGSDADPELLGKLADVGGGSYYFIESPEEVPDVFGEALGGLLSTNCQNVEVTLTPTIGSGVELHLPRSPYKTEALPNGAFKVHVGDLYEEEQKDLVVQLKVPPFTSSIRDPRTGAVDQQQSLMAVLVRYVDLATGKMEQTTAHLSIRRPEVVDAEQVVSELVRYHVARLETAAALEASQTEADGGNLRAGRERLEEALKNLRLMTENKPGQAGGVSEEIAAKLAVLEADVNLAAQKFTDEHTYRMEGKSRAYMMSKAHFKQRSTGVVSQRSNDALLLGMPMMEQYTSCYVTPKQRSCRASAKSVAPTRTMQDHKSAPVRSQRKAARSQPNAASNGDMRAFLSTGFAFPHDPMVAEPESKVVAPQLNADSGSTMRPSSSDALQRSLSRLWRKSKSKRSSLGKQTKTPSANK